MKNINILFVIIFMPFLLLGQEGLFSLKVNTDTVHLGAKIEIIYSIENIKGDFKAPDFSDFIVISGPNTSTQMQWINGTFSNSKSISFILSPKKLGTCKIESAEIKNTKDLVRTDPIEIICVDPSISHNQKLDSVPFLSDEKVKESALKRAKRHKT